MQENKNSINNTVNEKFKDLHIGKKALIIATTIVVIIFIILFINGSNVHNALN